MTRSAYSYRSARYWACVLPLFGLVFPALGMAALVNPVAALWALLVAGPSVLLWTCYSLGKLLREPLRFAFHGRELNVAWMRKELRFALSQLTVTTHPKLQGVIVSAPGATFRVFDNLQNYDEFLSLLGAAPQPSGHAARGK